MQYNIKGRWQPATTLVTMGVVSLVYYLHCDRGQGLRSSNKLHLCRAAIQEEKNLGIIIHQIFFSQLNSAFQQQTLLTELKV